MDYLEKRDWTLGTPEPKTFWKRWKWRRARKCVNCNGWGTVFRGMTCPDCRGRGYYLTGGLYGDRKGEPGHPLTPSMA